MHDEVNMPVSRSLMALSLAFAMATAQARGYDAAAWQADYAQLKQAMEQDYANLAWFASPEGGVNLPRLDRLTRQALQAARSDAEANKQSRASCAPSGTVIVSP